jgi:hypothetical protein
MKKLFLLSIILLSSCSLRKYKNSDYVATQFSEEKKAVVVFTFRGKNTIFGSAPYVSFDLVKVNKQVGVGSENQTFYRYKPGILKGLNPWMQDYITLMIEPGFYIIDNIAWTEGNVNFYTPQGMIPTSTPVQFGGFEVKPGTVNYLGDLTVNAKYGTFSVDCSINLDKAKSHFAKHQPDLAKKLKYCRFLPAGYHTFLDKEKEVPDSESNDDDRSIYWDHTKELKDGVF